MNITILEYLNHILKRTSISNFTIKRGATSINIIRSYDQIMNEAKPKRTRPEAVPAKEIKPEEIEKEEKLTTLKAQTVGVFYRGKTKIGAALAKTGSEVKKGEQVGIIDCMGVAEMVKANATGVIREVLAETHKPVEYGQPLFIIETK
ncbi:MAG: hypothetical protein KKH98_08080 [Spirochaetes bacterium]|nr:hypothetical protein [Spirochaetota bacterium]